MRYSNTTQFALSDIASGISQYRLGIFLAWNDIRQRYARTFLGPMWIVLNSCLWFAVMGLVMASLMGQPLATYFPFLVSGLIIWIFIANNIVEGPSALMSATPLILNLRLPITVHYIRFIARNIIIFLHNAAILGCILLLFPSQNEMHLFQAFIGLFLNAVLLTAIIIILSFMHLRYRDTQMAVTSAMQVMPIITPLFWSKDMLQKHQWIADLNPFYHMVQIVRAPLLGEAVSEHSWELVSVFCLVTMIAALTIFIRFRHRIYFWV
jgi:ABC-type polysaccharide/polyol phosphate export permease